MKRSPAVPLPAVEGKCGDRTELLEHLVKTKGECDEEHCSGDRSEWKTP